MQANLINRNKQINHYQLTYNNTKNVNYLTDGNIVHLMKLQLDVCLLRRPSNLLDGQMLLQLHQLQHINNNRQHLIKNLILYTTNCSNVFNITMHSPKTLIQGFNGQPIQDGITKLVFKGKLKFDFYYLCNLLDLVALFFTAWQAWYIC